MPDFVGRTESKEINQSITTFGDVNSNIELFDVSLSRYGCEVLVGF